MKPKTLTHTHHVPRVVVDLLQLDIYVLASFGMVTETARNTFTTNNVTKTLSAPGKQATIIH
jgi:hypothetical protein